MPTSTRTMANNQFQEQMTQLMSLMAENQRIMMEDCQREREVRERREQINEDHRNAREQFTPVFSSSKEPKVNDPDTYDGRSDKLNQFITQCDLVFRVQPSRFATETVKVHFIISYLRGIALDAVRPLLGQEDDLDNIDDPVELASKAAFFDYLRSSFGDPDEKGTARRKLTTLKQTSNASAYFAKFRELIAILGWKDQEPIVFRAIDGLTPSLKDEIARSGREFETFDDLVRYIVPLDNRLRVRDLERKQEDEKKDKEQKNAKPPAPASTPASNVSSTHIHSHNPPPIPAVSFNVSTTAPFRPVTGFTPGSHPRPSVSPEEKERRRVEGLCSYCGGPHARSECPRNPPPLPPRPNFQAQGQSQGPP